MKHTTPWFIASRLYAAAAAGVVLMHLADPSDAYLRAPVVGLVHLVTLGTLGHALIGQSLAAAVRAGAPAPTWWGNALAFLSFTAGVGMLTAGLLTTHPGTIFHAITALSLGVVLSGLMLGRLFWRMPQAGAQRTGLRAGGVALLAVTFLGLWIVHGHAQMHFPGPRSTWVLGHISAGILGWAGLTMDAIDEAKLNPWWPRAIGAISVLPALLLILTWWGGPPSWQPAVIAACAALAAAWVWLASPALALRAGRRDLGTLLGPLCMALAAGAYFQPSGALPALWAWVCLVGWAPARLFQLRGPWAMGCALAVVLGGAGLLSGQHALLAAGALLFGLGAVTLGAAGHPRHLRALD